jgi:6-phosphogluconolactonase
MDPIVKIFANTGELSLFFAEYLAKLIRNTSTGHYFSMALSGGSTPKLVFEYLSGNYQNRIEWEKVLIFWGDERCVPPDSSESNFRMAKESFLDHVPIPVKNIFRIRGEADADVEAEHYAEVVRQHVSSVQNIPRFDLIMLGLGEDGHTASIFPGSLDLFASDRLFEATENPYSRQKRITATGKVINHSTTVIFLVTGEAKAEMAARIIEKGESWGRYPAAYVQPGNGELIWLLDEGAARKLH